MSGDISGGLLLSRQIYPFFGPIICIGSRRKLVLDMAHECMGHMGYRKVETLKSNLIWPFSSKEVRQHCASCQICHKAYKVGRHRMLMINRPVITEILEKNAIDILGPLPKCE